MIRSQQVPLFLSSVGGGGGVSIKQRRQPALHSLTSSLVQFPLSPSVPSVDICSDPFAMGVIDLDLSEFENPRPTRISTSAEPPKAPSSDGEEFSREHAPPSRSKKRKLPYRADVVVEGRRYKGKRVSRGEADLDVEAIGLLDDSRSHENEPVEDASSGEELEDDLSHLPDGDHSDMEVEDKEEDAAQVVSSRAERLEAEERAVAARIVEIEKKELIRARAVRKQKVSFDCSDIPPKRDRYLLQPMLMMITYRARLLIASALKITVYPFSEDNGCMQNTHHHARIYILRI